MNHVVDFVQRYLDREHALHELDVSEQATEENVGAGIDELKPFFKKGVPVAREFLHFLESDVEEARRIDKRNDLAKPTLFAIEQFGTGKKALYRAYLGGNLYYTRDGFHRALGIRDDGGLKIITLFRIESVRGPIAWESTEGEKVKWGKPTDGLRLFAPTDEKSLVYYNAMSWPKLGPEAEPGRRPSRKDQQARINEIYSSGSVADLRAFLDQNPTTVAGQESWLYDLVWEFERPDLVEVFVERIGRDMRDATQLAINAVTKGHAKSLRALWPVIRDVNAKNSDEDTILTAATRSGNVEAVEIAIAGKPDLNAGGAAESGHEIKELEEDGNWPLANAVRAKSERIVDLLLTAGADPNLRTSSPRSVLEMAEAVGYAPVIERIRAAGAKGMSPDELNFFEAAKVGAIPRMLALAPEQEIDEVLRTCAQFGRIEGIDHAASRGAKLPKEKLDQALYMAAQQGHAPVVRRLLELGASPDAKSRIIGQSALVTAVAQSHVDVVRALLEAGGSTKQTKQTLDDSQGPIRMMSMLAVGGGKVTVDAQLLHDAVYRGNAEIVQMLIDAGADVNAYSKNGGCPLDVAYEHDDDRSAIAKILEAAGAHRARDRKKAAKKSTAKKAAKKAAPKKKAAKKPAAKKKAAKKPAAKKRR